MCLVALEVAPNVQTTHKVACATYVLQKDAEVWWSDNKHSINPGAVKGSLSEILLSKETRINPGGGITTWGTFKGSLSEKKCQIW